MLTRYKVRSIFLLFNKREHPMPNQKVDFWNNFDSQDFNQAAETFDELTAADKSSILSELFQKSQYASEPQIVSVLIRNLHEGKKFEDFHKAWMPEQSYLNTVEQDGGTYHQFFPAPTRVLNAVNLNNPDEIVSVGLTWFISEEQGHMMQKFASTESPANQARVKNIKRVADKESANVYVVKTDDNLGVPF